MTPDEALTLEQVLSAHRQRGADGGVRPSPAWHDLPPEARQQAFEATVQLRELERHLDPLDRSTTVAAVLARLR